MSELAVEVQEVQQVLPHPNPVVERLEIAKILGWECIVSKGSLKAGDKVIYFPIDSLLPAELENRVFGPDAKVRLNGKKVKTISIKGAFSQGLAVPLAKFPEYWDAKAGDNLTEKLGVTKWEPKEEEPNAISTKGRQASKKETNPHFRKYTDLQHLKKEYWWYAPGEEVVATEKLHGTSARYALLPNASTTWWKNLLAKLRILPKWQFCYGSRNVQLQTRWLKKPIYSGLPGDVYTKVLNQYSLKDKIRPGEAVYGEIVGAGIQKGYAYGLSDGKVEFYIYDVQVNGRWLNHDELAAWCEERDLEMVPTLYRGPFDMGALAPYTRGPSTIAPEAQPIREGLVVRPIQESVAPDGNSRKVSKWVSEEFLLRNAENEGTDWH